jgi:hypothetical protein
MRHLHEIVSRFITEGRVHTIESFGNGHINDTFLVITYSADTTDYVLQRINHRIFTNVPALMENILLVTRHLQQRLRHRENIPDSYEALRLILTDTGACYHKDADGNYWRLYEYVRNSVSYDKVPGPEFACQGGRAFGIFQHLTSGIDPSSLHVTIPEFHCIARRLWDFREAHRVNRAGRAESTAPETEFAESRAEVMHTIKRLGDEGKIPLRVTHNDTKFNNILFNQSNKAIAVADLDTVMPGYVLYDFGDAIRTGASSAAEDEGDLAKMHIDLDLFEAYSKGYLEFARSFLTSDEINHLAFSATFMTYIIGLRFLTDYIDGDRYFKTGFPQHNLQRARAQFKLLRSMEEKYSEMQAIIAKLK